MRKKTKDEFIIKAKSVHGDKYDYTKVVYKGIHTKVCIVCPIHGEFWQEPNNHISRKTICPACSRKIASERLHSNNQEFIAKANNIHQGKYDYSKVDYHHNEENICIICPKHGEFWQSPHNHLRGAGCPSCSGNYIPTTDEFIKLLKQKFGDKYDYSKVEYKGNKVKVCIICPEHGEFWMTPNQCRKQKGCPKCSGNYGINKDSFIQLSNTRFQNKYDYSKIEWKGYRKKVRIICPIHGDFLQSPILHLKTSGCPKCSGSYLDKELFVEKANSIHNYKYDYSMVTYRGNKTKVCIVCPEHGRFWQTPNDHLQGHGCRKCYENETKIRLTKPFTDFLIIAQNVHGNKYDYSQANYESRLVPIKIICPKHGPFMQTPKSHLKGSGCPLCNNSILENEITQLLQYYNIPFIPQKTFHWLKYNGNLYLDFYLYEHNIVIECQGIQHFHAVEFFGGLKGLYQTKKRDAVKKELCAKRGIKVLYFSNLGIKYPYEVIENPHLLIRAIKSSNTMNKKLVNFEPELPFDMK